MFDSNAHSAELPLLPEAHSWNSTAAFGIFASPRVATHMIFRWLQFVLAPSPARAHFLNPEEKAWLQNRQDTQHKLSAERNPHQGAWWGVHLLLQMHLCHISLPVHVVLYDPSF